MLTLTVAIQLLIAIINLYVTVSNQRKKDSKRRKRKKPRK